MSTVVKVNGTGAGIMAVTLTVPPGRTYRLYSVTCKFSAAPTTSENFTITLDANAGADYDTALYTVDPSVTSITSLLWQPDEPLLLEGGDAIDVAFANTDVATYGVQITAETVG